MKLNNIFIREINLNNISPISSYLNYKHNLPKKYKHKNKIKKNDINSPRFNRCSRKRINSIFNLLIKIFKNPSPFKKSITRMGKNARKSKIKIKNIKNGKFQFFKKIKRRNNTNS